MIKVTRSPKPQILVNKEADWLLTLQVAKTSSAKEKAQKHYRNTAIRKALEALFHGKCAYCESKIIHVMDAHIEHFRPKSKFETLTFHWDNLLLACGKCNGTSQKGDKFPEASDGGPIINPCNEEPSIHLQFYYDPVAELASVYLLTGRGECTIDLLGLNRPDLRTHRSRYVTMLYCIALKATKDKDAQAQAIFAEAQQGDAEYAAFARAIANTLGP